jgi:uncharacterized protein HemX
MQKILAAVAGTIALIAGLAVSVVAFAVIAALAVVFGLYLWWKTRTLRAHLAEQMRARSAQATETAPTGIVVEGEWSHAAETATTISESTPLPRADAGDARGRGSAPTQ